MLLTHLIRRQARSLLTVPTTASSPLAMVAAASLSTARRCQSSGSPPTDGGPAASSAGSSSATPSSTPPPGSVGGGAAAAGSSRGSAAGTSRGAAPGGSINSVTLVGVVHDIQTGYVFEDAVTQFTLTTTSLDTTHPSHECVVEKDHHTIRCFGDLFSQEVKKRIKEGNVVCVNGRLRLNPQLEPSCNKYYYFPFVHVQPPHGQVAVVYGDRRAPPTPTNPSNEEITSESPAAGEGE